MIPAAMLSDLVLETVGRLRQLIRPRGKAAPRVMARLQWRCARGHVWDASPKSLKSESNRCPQCAAIEAAKIKWSCPEGHEWVTPAGRIGSNNGGRRGLTLQCPECSRPQTSRTARIHSRL